MAITSLEQQKQLGRYLDTLRKANDADEGLAGENPEAGRVKSAGFVAFLMLGSFALLKDVFDFVFVGMAFFKSRLVSGADAAGNAADAASLALLFAPDVTWTKIIAAIAKLVGWAAMGASWAGSVVEAKTQVEGVILPFLFTNMFMIGVVATLLLSGTGLKSHKIFLSTRFIFLTFVATIAEIIPVLNILPWTVLYVVFLYFTVKHIRKKQVEQQTAYK